MSNVIGKIGQKSDTRVMHVGAERYEALSKKAIYISYKGNRQITASQVGKYVLDNFLEEGAKKLLEEIGNS